jgi:DNA primase
MSYSKEKIEEVRNRAEIVDVISEDVVLKKVGRNFVGFSPFNQERTPSFVVSPDKQIFKCFSSGKSGNVFSFIMEYHGMSFNEAVKNLAEKFGIKLTESSVKEKEQEDIREMVIQALAISAEFYADTLFSNEGKQALDYFYKRGFSKQVIQQFQLGYSPDAWDTLSNRLVQMGFNKETLLEAGLVNENQKGGFYDRFRSRIMFPIKDFLGRVIGFGARTMKIDSDEPKYVNSPQTIVYDKSKTLYGISESKNEIRNKSNVVLVEGYADVLSLYDKGIKNVVASSGTALTTQQLSILKRFAKQVFLVYDSDEAGQKAADKSLELAINLDLDISVVALPEGEDPDSYVQKHGKDAFDTALGKAMNFVDFKVFRYKKQNLLSNPAQISQASKEILEAISKIPDTFQHDSYIRILADRLNLTESQLRIVYSQHKKIAQKDNAQKSQPTAELNQLGEQEIASLPIEELLPEERTIIKIMLLEKDGFFLVTEKLEIGIDIFHTKVAKELYELIYEFEGHDNILNAMINSDSVEEHFKSQIINLCILEETPSENWEKFGVDIPPQDIEKALIQSKMKLEILQLDTKIRILSQRIKISTDLEEEHQSQREIADAIIQRNEIKSKYSNY